MAEPDGSNPLARVYLIAYEDGDGAITPDCNCGATLPLPTNVEVNLQDLVLAAHDHAGECPLHKANLAAIQYRRNRD